MSTPSHTNLDGRLLSRPRGAAAGAGDNRSGDAAALQRATDQLARAASDLSAAAKALRSGPTVGVVRE